MLDQLHIIFALPLGQLLVGAVIILAGLALKLIELAREQRRMLEYRDLITRARLRAIHGGKRGHE